MFYSAYYPAPVVVQPRSSWAENCCIHQATVVLPSIFIGALGLAILLGVSRQAAVMRQMRDVVVIQQVQKTHAGWYAVGLVVGAVGGFFVGEMLAGVCAMGPRPITFECCLAGAICLDMVQKTR